MGLLANSLGDLHASAQHDVHDSAALAHDPLEALICHGTSRGQTSSCHTAFLFGGGADPASSATSKKTQRPSHWIKGHGGLLSWLFGRGSKPGPVSQAAASGASKKMHSDEQEKTAIRGRARKTEVDNKLGSREEQTIKRVNK